MFINDLFNKKKKLKESNRAGNNKLRDKDDYLDKKDHLLKLLSMPNVPVEDKAVIKDRLAQLEKAAQSLDEQDVAEGSKDSAPKMSKQERKLAQDALKGAKDMSAALGLVRGKDGVLRMPKNKEQGVAEGGRDDAYTRDVKASQTGFDRPHDHRGLSQELAHETNNIQIAINGRPWKVVPGKGYADSREERAYLEGMKRWAEKKSASSGKKWTVYLTGANVTESTEHEPTYGKSPEDLGGADAWYHRGCNPGKYGFERGTVAFDSYLQGYKKSDEGSAGGKQWESAATESDIDKHVMEMRHAGYDLAEGHGSYYCSTKKRMVQRKGPKQTRSSK